jgi:ATP-binding cassette subfamily F protein uup
MLMNYQGTILMVSHDREFINNIATNSIVFEDGTINEYLGGYDDWIAQRTPDVEVSKKQKSNKSKNMPKIEAKSKLSQDQRKQLRNIPMQIEKIEKAITLVDAQMSEPSFYKKTDQEVKQAQKLSDDLNSELLEKYETWELLLSME